jgi:hypothetical protein
MRGLVFGRLFKITSNAAPAEEEVERGEAPPEMAAYFESMKEDEVSEDAAAAAVAADEAEAEAEGAAALLLLLLLLSSMLAAVG